MVAVSAALPGQLKKAVGIYSDQHNSIEHEKNSTLFCSNSNLTTKKYSIQNHIHLLLRRSPAHQHSPINGLSVNPRELHSDHVVVTSQLVVLLEVGAEILRLMGTVHCTSCWTHHGRYLGTICIESPLVYISLVSPFALTFTTDTTATIDTGCTIVSIRC